MGSAVPEGVEAVFLYGSALGPLFRSDSDIDIALLDRESSPLSWRDQARLMDTLERATGHGVDLRMLRESSPSHQAHVLEHGRLVWSRDPAEIERFTRKALAAARRQRERSELAWPQALDRLAGLVPGKAWRTCQRP
ncbi:MAG TPA: nucleotidyltransferase domain-containing protein [Thermoanaerobaculia bacterium]|nr:nucleotidyltransferase domain-containing protein [Thermoanaerobaculia bacterium]